MSIIAAGTTTTTALSSTGNTDGTLQFQVNGTTASVTLNTLGAIGVGSSPAFGTSGQVLTSAGSTAAPSWSTNVSSQWTTTGSDIYYNTGNVGIGTSSPLYKLQVISGDTTQAARFQYAGNTSFQPTVVIRNTADGNSFISQLDFLGQNTTGTDQKAFIAAQMNSSGFAPNLIFGPANGSGSNTLNMRLDSSGNLGIGTTTANISGGGAGTQVLTLSASASARNAVIELKGTRTSADQVSSYIRSFSNSAVTPGVDLQFYRGTADTDGFLTISTSNTERLRIAANGAFGLSGANYGSSGQVLTSGGSGAAPTWSTPGAGFSNLVVFTSSTTWTVPAGITKCKVTVTGGGGGGASGNSSTRLGLQGGGAGATATKIVTLSGSSATITIGAGGTAVTGGSNGNSGANSTFVYSATTVTGGGGSGGVLDGTGQNGGTASGGDINIFGGDGFSVSYPNTITAYGGLGGASFWGGGGTGAAGGAYSGRAYGSGGGGNNTNGGSGGAGAAGVIVIEY